jgi:RNA polymerase sigma factor (sigma-70 family)
VMVVPATVMARSGGVPKLPTSTDLVGRARRGDPAAFELLILGLGPKMDALARLILRDRQAAEDAVQDALLAAWRELSGLRDDTRFEPWLFRILVNQCRQQHRKRRSSVIAQADFAIGSDETGALSDRDRLERAFVRLSPDQRAAIVLRYYLVWSPDEIATHLGIGESTVRSRIRLGLQAMRASIEADDRPAHVVRM